MANNFSGDSSCVALWNFEETPESFLEDSKGSNDLTNDGVDKDTTNYKVGSQAATFVLANADNFTITDANQDAGFPFRYDDTTSMEKSFTMCCWINPDVITSTDYFFAKYDAGGGNRVFAIALNSTGDVFKFNLGYNSGGDYDPYDHSGTVTVGRWYHVAFSYNADTLEYRMRVWDDNGSALLADDKTGIASNAIDACDTPLIIGTRDGGNGAFGGHLDEMVVFNRVLSVYEIDQIRAGTFSTYSLISTVAAVTTLDAVTLNVNRQLISSIVNATTVSSIDVLLVKFISSTIVMSTTVSSVDVLKILNFISTIAEEVSVSGIDLNVERLLVATTELVTTLGDIDLPIERLLESAVANVTTASSIDLLRINNFISTITNTTTLSSIDVGITSLLISTIAMVTTLDPITVVQVLIDGIASSGVVDKTYLYKALGVFADAYVVRDYSYNEHVVDKSYVYTTKNATI